MGKDFPNLEMLDARIASALNEITQNSQPKKKKVSLEEQKAQKEDRFLRGRQVTFMIHDNFRVSGTHVLFSITRTDNVQEFDTRWDGILLSMTRTPLGDVLESLYTLRTRESDQLKNRI